MRIDEIKTEHGKQVYSRQDVSLLDKYRDNIINYHNTKMPIYRGMGHSTTRFDHVLLGNGKLINRKSIDGNNIYTMLMDNLPAWKNYPKRSKSFICTTFFGKAKAYGKTYICIPLENQPIALCPQGDIWQSFEPSFDILKTKDIGSIPGLTAAIEDLASMTKEILKMKKISTEFDDLNIMAACYGSSFDELKKVLKLFKLGGLKLSGEDISFYRNKFDVDNSPLFKGSDPYMLGALNNALSPEVNGFKLLPANSFDSGLSISQHTELWFSGKALFIENQFYKKYVTDGFRVTK